jgi:hypothetical protein
MEQVRLVQEKHGVETVASQRVNMLLDGEEDARRAGRCRKPEAWQR